MATREIFLLTENAEILEAAELAALVRAGVGVVGGRGGGDLEAGGGRGGGGGGAGAGHQARTLAALVTRDAALLTCKRGKCTLSKVRREHHQKKRDHQRLKVQFINFRILLNSSY